MTGNRYLGLTVQGVVPPLFVPRPAWFDEARCSGLGASLFYVDTGNKALAYQARAICAECPVRLQCLDHALVNDEYHGIWGGTTWRERKAMRPRRRPPILQRATEEP